MKLQTISFQNCQCYRISKTGSTVVFMGRHKNQMSSNGYLSYLAINIKVCLDTMNITAHLFLSFDKNSLFGSAAYLPLWGCSEATWISEWYWTFRYNTVHWLYISIHMQTWTSWTLFDTLSHMEYCCGLNMWYTF